MAHPRGRKFVDRQVQGALLRRITIHWLLFALGLTLVLLVLQYFVQPFESFGDQLRALGQRHGVVLVVLFALLPVFLWDTVRISHRFAGPMVRFRRLLKDLADGKAVSDISFRDGDFWAELATDFNAVKARLEASGQLSDHSDTNEYEVAQGASH